MAARLRTYQWQVALAGAIVLGALVLTAASPARPPTPTARAATWHKCSWTFVPCLGTYESDYNYITGSGEGNLSQLRATFGKQVGTGQEVTLSYPIPGTFKATTRKITWKAASGVEIVAVFEVVRPFSHHKPYARRLPTGRSSGHATLHGYANYTGPPLILEGRRASASRASSQPKTVFQCQKTFPHSKPKRTSCIKRVMAEKPGTSCEHPIKSSLTLGGPAGDQKDFRVTEKVVSPTFNTPGSTETVTAEVVVLNPRIQVCGVELFDTGFNYDTGRFEKSKQHAYHLRISPNGGVSSSVTIPDDARFALIATAKWK